MKAGFDRRVITPNIFENIELGGYGYFLSRRPEKLDGDLYVTSLAVEGNNGDIIAISSLDLVGLDDRVVRNIRGIASERTGIPSDNIMVVCTHTHSGPATLDILGCGAINHDYVEEVANVVIESIYYACSVMGDSTVGFNRTSVGGISYNREGRKELDTDLHLVKFEGNTDALLLNFSCHPTILGRSSTLLSRDYPGYAGNVLEDFLAINDSVLWTTGCCADIDPLVNKDRKDRAGIGDLASMGNRIAYGAFSAYRETETFPADVYVAGREVEFPFDESFAFDCEGEIEAYMQLKFGKNTDGFVRFMQELKKGLESPHLPKSRAAKISGFRIGNYALVGIPAEVYSSTGLSIRGEYPDTVLITCANGIVGYIPPMEEFERNTYAARRGQFIYNRRPFRHDCEEILRKNIEWVLDELDDVSR